MTWTVHRWVWRLEAPLFIGLPPAGSLNRTRLYVPARAVHGAVTAELARLKGDEESKFPCYGKFGKEVGVNCRFTYLYPAEKNGDDYLVWCPEYVKPEADKRNENDERKFGLRWRRQDGADISDRDFRRRLLDSRPATAVAPETDAAAEETLRETECLNPWWRNPSEPRAEPKPVFLLGYVFLKNNGFRQRLEGLETLFVGGDLTSGLGRLRRESPDDRPADQEFTFGRSVHLDKENPEIKSGFVWGHALGDGRASSRKMWGLKELLGGWNPGSLWKGDLAWAPGSSSENNQEVGWSIDSYGVWIPA